MAVRYLHRREHSAAELYTKLRQKGAESTAIYTVIELCQQEGWQCNKRFTSMWLRNCYHKGQGLQKVRYQLEAEHQVPSLVVQEVLAELSLDWYALAENVIRKKYPAFFDPEIAKSSCIDRTLLQRKAYRFLAMRGFDTDTISSVLCNTPL